MKDRDELDTLSLVYKCGQLVDGVTFPSIRPFIVRENDIVEPKSVLLHVEEPHAHGAGPGHETQKLK